MFRPHQHTIVQHAAAILTPKIKVGPNCRGTFCTKSVTHTNHTSKLFLPTLTSDINSCEPQRAPNEVNERQTEAHGNGGCSNCVNESQIHATKEKVEFVMSRWRLREQLSIFNSNFSLELSASCVKFYSAETSYVTTQKFLNLPVIGCFPCRPMPPHCTMYTMMLARSLASNQQIYGPDLCWFPTP